MKLAPRTVRILLVSAGVAVVAYVIAWFLPKVYETSASLYFPMGSASTSSNPLEQLKGGGGSAPGEVSLPYGIQFPLVGAGPQTAIGILTSRSCQLHVVGRLGLAQKWETSEREATKRVGRAATASVDKNGLLRLRVEGGSPEECVAIANEMLAFLNQKSKDMTRNLADESVEYVRAQIQVERQKLAQLSNKTEAILRESPLGRIEDVQSRYLAARDTYESALARAAAARTSLNSLTQSSLQALKANKAMPPSAEAYETIGEAIAGIADTLHARRLAFQDAVERYQPGSPEFQIAKESLETAEDYLDNITEEERQLVAQRLTPRQRQIRTQLDSLEVELGALRSTLQRYEKAAAEAPEQYVAMSQAQAEWSTALSNMGMLEGQLLMARIAAERNPTLFEVLDPPVEDPDPVAPGKIRIALIAFLLVLLLQAAPIMAAKLSEKSE